MKRNGPKNFHRCFFRGMAFLHLLFALAACAGAGGGSDAIQTLNQQPDDTHGQWTWVSGDSKTNRRGVYGTLGVGDAVNKPGARSGAVSWVDLEDNLWLFGGKGYADKRRSQYLGDLWKYDGSDWTWVSGDNTGSEHSVYGTIGNASPGNKPGGRTGAVSWIDGQGNLWLFGGEGYARKGFLGHLNDLWKFDGRSWTWVSGDNRIDRGGTYGTRGMADTSNKPGARSGAVSWIDAQGNLWLFGGYGYDGFGAEGYLNDLWRFDGTNWTWVGGDNTRYETGDYGTLGIATETNKPGARSSAVGWVDSDGNFGLFGGHGNANIGWKSSDVINQDRRKTGAGHLNDRWKFDGTHWTWLSGDGKAFFTPEVDFDSMETPSARFGSTGWMDPAGNLWLLGGSALIRFTNVTNDFWKFDGTDWHRIFAGSERKERQGNYGTRGMAAGTNMPPARSGAVGWTDSEGNLWLFGGRKPLSKGSFEYFNDLWKYEP